jgi:hypothetical protein
MIIVAGVPHVISLDRSVHSAFPPKNPIYLCVNNISSYLGIWAALLKTFQLRICELVLTQRSTPSLRTRARGRVFLCGPGGGLPRCSVDICASRLDLRAARYILLLTS